MYRNDHRKLITSDLIHLHRKLIVGDSIRHKGTVVHVLKNNTQCSLAIDLILSIMIGYRKASSSSITYYSFFRSTSRVVIITPNNGFISPNIVGKINNNLHIHSTMKTNICTSLITNIKKKTLEIQSSPIN